MTGDIGILGGAGFVGSAYSRLFTALGFTHTVIGRENYEAVKGTRFSVFINANGNSKKFLSDRDPVWEFDASVASVCRALSDFPSDTYVQLSTGDVYPSQLTPQETREDQIIAPERLSRYGLHKYLAETLVRGAHPNWLVMRMGGFVGPGLKKNAIFDMLSGADLWLGAGSQLQFLHTDTAAQLVWSLIEAGVRRETINLGALGMVHIGALHTQTGSSSGFRPDAANIRFELNIDKLGTLTPLSLPHSITEVDRFIAAEGP